MNSGACCSPVSVTVQRRVRGTPVRAQAPQVVGHLAGGDVLGAGAEQGRDQGAQVTVGEAVDQEPVDEQGLQQCVHPVVAEAQPRDAGAFLSEDRGGEVMECLRATSPIPTASSWRSCSSTTPRSDTHRCTDPAEAPTYCCPSRRWA